MAVAYDWWPKSLYTTGQLPQSSASNDTAASGITLLVFLSYENPNITEVLDNKGNTFTLFGTVQGGFSGYSSARSAVYICENATGGAGHIITANGAGYAYLSMYAVALSGVVLTSGVDGAISQVVDSGSSPWNAASLVTTNADDVLFAFASVMGSGTETLSESTGFSHQVSETNGAAYWSGGVFIREVAATGTYTPSFTSAGSASEMMLHVLGLKIDLGSGGNSGSLSKTLGAATAAGTGTVSTTGSTSRTLGSATLDGTGTVPVSGTLARTLGAATVFGYDAGSISGSLNRTLGAVTGVGSGSMPVSGTLSKALGAAVMSGAGSVAISGSGSGALGATSVIANDLQNAPTLGAHVLDWCYLGEGTDPTTTAAITTQASGSSILVVQANHVSNSGVGPPIDSESNTYTQVGTRRSYTEFPNYGMDVWACEAATGGSGHTVTVQQDGTPTEELDLYVVEIKNAGRLQAHSYVQIAAGNDLISNSVTTTGPATLIAFWFGDSLSANHTAVPRDGFTVFDSILSIGDLIQSAAAYKNVSSAGTYTVQWDETPNQGAILLLFAFEATGSVAGSLSKTLGAATVGAAGSVTIGASLSATLSPVAGAASGSVGIAGTALPTLAAVTAAGAGVLPITGQASPTLGAVTLASSNGNVGATNVTLGPVGATGSAAVSVTGAVSRTLGAAQLDTDGSSTITASGAVTLGAVTASGAAAGGPIVGSANITLGGVTLQATENPIVTPTLPTVPAYNYGPLAATATRMLIRFGAACHITRRASLVYDTATGTTTGATSTLYTRAAVFDQPTKNIDGTLIKAGDLQAYMVKEVEPKIGDVLTWAGRDLTITSVKALAPAGAALIYEANLRG